MAVNIAIVKQATYNFEHIVEETGALCEKIAQYALHQHQYHDVAFTAYAVKFKSGINKLLKKLLVWQEYFETIQGYLAQINYSAYSHNRYVARLRERVQDTLPLIQKEFAFIEEILSELNIFSNIDSPFKDARDDLAPSQISTNITRSFVIIGHIKNLFKRAQGTTKTTLGDIHMIINIHQELEDHNSSNPQPRA